MSLVFSSDKDGTALCWIRDCGLPEKVHKKGAKRALDGFDEIRLTALKGMAGATRLELATSAVTGQQRRATYWISAVPTARSWSSKKLFAPAYRTQIGPKTEHSEMSP
jgi:hypothetical protein